MDGIFGVFNALGTVAFAYGGHNVILEIQVLVQKQQVHHSYSRPTVNAHAFDVFSSAGPAIAHQFVTALSDLSSNCKTGSSS